VPRLLKEPRRSDEPNADPIQKLLNKSNRPAKPPVRCSLGPCGHVEKQSAYIELCTYLSRALYANDIRHAAEWSQDSTMTSQKETEQKSRAGLGVREVELQLIDYF
jgi:hypothetical protein